MRCVTRQLLNQLSALTQLNQRVKETQNAPVSYLRGKE